MKNAKTTIVTLIFTLIMIFGSIYCVYSQNDNNPKSSLNLYVNNAYEQIEDRYISDFDSLAYMKKLRLGYVSIAYENYFDNGNSHEFELMPFSIGFDDYYGERYYNINNATWGYGQNLLYVESTFRYQYNIRITDWFFIGLSPKITYNFTSVKPISSMYYPKNLHVFNFATEIIPGFQTRIFNDVYFGISFPFRIFASEYYIRKIENPNLSIDNQKGKGFKNRYLPYKYYLRLGLKYKF